MNKTKASVFVLSALALCGLILPSCDVNTASDTNTSSTSELPGLDVNQVTSVMIKDGVNRDVAVGTTVEVRPNINVRLSGASESISGDAYSYAMTLTANTPNVTVDNDKGTFTVTGAGDYAVRITIGTVNRVWQGTGISQAAFEIRELASKVTNTYTAKFYAQQGATTTLSLFNRIVHDEDYVRVDQTSGSYGYLRSGLGHCYMYEYLSNGTIEVAPGRMIDLSYLIVGADISIASDSIVDVIDDDGNVLYQTMDMTTFSDVAYTASAQPFDATALEESGHLEVSTYTDEKGALALRMDYIFTNETDPYFRLDIENIGVENQIPAVENYIASKEEPTPLKQEKIESVLTDITTNKLSYTLVASTQVGYFDDNGSWHDYADPTAVGSISQWGFTTSSQSITFVNGDNYYSLDQNGNVTAYLPGEGADTNIYSVVGKVTSADGEFDINDEEAYGTGFTQSGTATASGLTKAGTPETTVDGGEATSDGIWSKGIAATVSGGGQTFTLPAPITITDLTGEAFGKVDLNYSESQILTDTLGLTELGTFDVAAMTPYGDEEEGNFIYNIIANIPGHGYADAYTLSGMTDSTYTMKWYDFLGVAQIGYYDFNTEAEAAGNSDMLTMMVSSSGWGSAVVDGSAYAIELMWNITVMDIGKTSLPEGFMEKVTLPTASENA